ncbi:hypothetical protein RJ640_020332 [Escallonia rubra]|uniref:ent-kaurene monooxygenase n=1 Tax=Escallonia rubra TaxID=112253 RepID=A0AA88U349_9ASTE|nr:hypothetical protein RJ640_020332 [Escallonia rubra]
MDAVLNIPATLPMGAAIAVGGPAIALGGLSLWFLKGYVSDHMRGPSNLPPLPEVPGVPLLGNLLQMKEKKPHKTFLKWAETYGPIYSIKAGYNSMVVLNSNEVAKEAMVTRYPSISTRKLSKALKILTCDKAMVAMSDYDEFHKTVKRHILTNVLGPNAQKRHRCHRDTMIENISNEFHAYSKNYPHEAVNFRKIFESELFGLAMKQALGKDVENLYVEELGTTLSREEIFRVLVLDPMEGAIEVDWRDFFPYLKWIPNRGFEKRVEQMHTRRMAVMNALIREQKKRIALGEEINCYLDYLLTEAKTLSHNEITMLLWEAIIETSDTTLVTTEWAMYELAKDQKRQVDRLLLEIESVCGSGKITEEKLCQLPYLSAVFHETLRNHSPVPVIPLRYAHEETQIGGYRIPAGSEIAINLYGCNMEKEVWENPEEWNPERFLSENNDPVDLHKTMAFGGGRRVCAGALQAMLISCVAIARLVQEFEWKLKDGEEDDVDTLGLTVLDILATLPIGAAIAVGGPAVALGGLFLWFFKGYLSDHTRGPSSLPPLPEVPGVPLLGNLLQMKEKKPHKTFLKWAETYGPIYSIKTGYNSMVVLNSNEVAKEAMVTRYPSISTRKLSKALKILSSDKAMVAMSDYDEFHKTVKRHILTNVLGSNAQKRHRCHRDTMIENISNQFHASLKNNPREAVNFRNIFESELFGLAMKQALGKDVENLYVEELGTTLSRAEIFRVLVHDPLHGAIEGRLLLEIESVSGSGKITEENLCQHPYLSAVFHETLRYHSPVPIIPLRYAHEKTQLGGYLIPAGTEIAINLYGCNMEKEVWENPEEWNPERFLSENNDPVDLYKTMAFGGGKRVCAGALQAMLISCVAIARFVQEFEWKLKDGEEDDADTLGLTGHKRHPMHAFLKSRK